MYLEIYGNGLAVVHNEVMNHVDCVIKHDVYPQKVHSRSKNIRGVSFFSVLKYPWYFKKKYIIAVIDIPMVER